MTITSREKQKIVRAAVGWIGGLTAIVICWIGLRIVMVFHNYFPPDFQHGFLAGRQSYFWTSVYGAGFYLHIIGAPIALLSGLTQFSRGLLSWSPRLHRLLGRIYAIAVILAAAPGGLVIGIRTFAGPSAAVCFVVMSLLVSLSTVLAWTAALQRCFTSHRRWMTRSYLLMVSAILLRLIDPALRNAGVPDTLSYQWSVWLSWVPSLVLFELLERWRTPTQTRQ
jgi:uncharacterized membrane protein